MNMRSCTSECPKSAARACCPLAPPHSVKLPPRLSRRTCRRMLHRRKHQVSAYRRAIRMSKNRPLSTSNICETFMHAAGLDANPMDMIFVATMCAGAYLVSGPAAAGRASSRLCPCPHQTGRSAAAPGRLRASIHVQNIVFLVSSWLQSRIREAVPCHTGLSAAAPGHLQLDPRSSASGIPQSGWQSVIVPVAPPLRRSRPS